MNINIHALSPLTSSPSSFKQSSTAEASDINWFNASLKTPVPESAHTSDNQFTPSLSQRSEFLQGLSNQAARRLQKVNNSTDPVDMLKSTRAMSAFHLETVLTAKMVSKTSQAIEKLTNLS